MSLLVLHGISRSFGGAKAVQRVSFNVEQGDALGLSGPNGSGKSTTVNLVCGVYPVDEGKIIFDGKKLTKKNDPKDRARMGLCRTCLLYKSSRYFFATLLLFLKKGRLPPISSCRKFLLCDSKGIQICTSEHSVQPVIVFLQSPDTLFSCSRTDT